MFNDTVEDQFFWFLLSTTMCTIILSCIRSKSITLFTSGTFHKKNEPKKPMINLDDFLKKPRMHWLERVVYTRVENKFCLLVEEIPPLLPSSMPGNAVYNTEADKSSVYLESNSKPSGAYMYTLRFSFMSDRTVLLHLFCLLQRNIMLQHQPTFTPLLIQVHSVPKIIFVSIANTCTNDT